eukprot:3275471-Amphidinium_carterae.1
MFRKCTKLTQCQEVVEVVPLERVVYVCGEQFDSLRTSSREGYVCFVQFVKPHAWQCQTLRPLEYEGTAPPEAFYGNKNCYMHMPYVTTLAGAIASNDFP